MSRWIINILEYDRIDIFEGINVNKTDKSKECMFCGYWCFLDKNFTYGAIILIWFIEKVLYKKFLFIFSLYKYE